MSPYTGKWRIGRKVWFEYMASAVSCQSAGLYKNDGKIIGTEKTSRGRVYQVSFNPDDDNNAYLLISEDEIKGYGTHPELLPEWERSS